jgi:hypothetical protein
MDLLKQQLSGAAIEQMSSRLGADRQATGNAVGAALPVLLEALARNADNTKGAQDLEQALARDHDGSLLDNLSAFLGGSSRPAPQVPPKATQGDSILGHILGRQRQKVESNIGRIAGLDANSAGQLMSMLAPILMGALGKARQQQNLDAGGLAGMLRGERQSIEKEQPKAGGIFGSLLDTDGDGDVDLGDLARGFGKFFG